MRQPAQQLVAAILEDDRLGDHAAEPGHTVAQPFWHAAAVKRQVCAARTPPHQRDPVAATRGAVSGRGPIAPPEPNSGSSSSASAGAESKFDTVTPSSRTPLAVGSSVRTSSTLAWRRRSWRAIIVEKLRLRVTWRKLANFTFTVTVRPKALALSHQAQTSSAMASTPASISADAIRSRSKVVSEPEDLRGRSATTGRSSWPFAIPRYQTADFPKCCCRKASDFVFLNGEDDHHFERFRYRRVKRFRYRRELQTSWHRFSST